MKKKTALTIAGSDSCGGAGIQADIKTMTVNGVYAMSAITALTAQNTTGVSDILEATPEFLAAQLDAVFTDIYPDAVKIGMVSSKALIETIAEKLRQYEAKNIVLDPVMVATSGAKLISDDAVQTLCRELMPLAAVVTPNIPEAEVLSGMTIATEEDMEKGNYNPFAQDYIIEGFEEKVRQILIMMMAEACREFEKLPIIKYADILRNILYSGVWCRFETVSEKRKEKQEKKHV